MQGEARAQRDQARASGARTAASSASLCACESWSGRSPVGRPAISTHAMTTWPPLVPGGAPRNATTRPPTTTASIRSMVRRSGLRSGHSPRTVLPDRVRDRLRDEASVPGGQEQHESRALRRAHGVQVIALFSSHYQRTGLVIDIGADSAQGDAADPAVVTALNTAHLGAAGARGRRSGDAVSRGRSVRASGTDRTISGGQDQRLLMLIARRGSVPQCRRSSRQTG